MARAKTSSTVNQHIPPKGAKVKPKVQKNKKDDDKLEPLPEHQIQKYSEKWKSFGFRASDEKGTQEEVGEEKDVKHVESDTSSSTTTSKSDTTRTSTSTTSSKDGNSNSSSSSDVKILATEGGRTTSGKPTEEQHFGLSIFVSVPFLYGCCSCRF